MGTKKRKRGSNFIVQGSILAVASILVRVIGLAYRIPVTRILGPVGNSYYSAAYEVYSMILLISSFSLPLAVSKLVSARMAKGRVRSAYKIFQCTLVFAVVSGGLGAPSFAPYRNSAHAAPMLAAALMTCSTICDMAVGIMDPSP